MPKQADVLQQCTAVFPKLKWRRETSSQVELYFSAKSERFVIELQVLREIGAICTFSNRKANGVISTYRSQNKRGISAEVALLEVREKIQKLSDEILKFLE